MTLLILFVALQAADAWTTWAGLAHGAREANPVMVRLIDRLGLPPALARDQAQHLTPDRSTELPPGVMA